MKKLKRLAAVLLAGIMALALFTACSDSDPATRSLIQRWKEPIRKR